MDSGSSSEVITHIEIQKEIDTIHVIIHIGFPNLLKKKGAIEELEKDLQKEVNSVNQRLNIGIEKVKEPYRQPNILAEYIAFQLKNRVSFRKAMKKAIELTKKTDIKGVKAVSREKKLRVPNASKKVDFPSKQFALKLIIAAIQFELSMEY
uniref:Uncharacterized protein n=1 Tax=Oryza nivara TaxID=4536 RepID=A0A0E0IIC8_ORYNI